MSESRASKFLELIRRSERGRLKVYLGFAPGVGKTYRMLQEAHRLRGEGIDVVVGLVETHDRAETAALLDGLEVLKRRRFEYKGITVEEFDLDAALVRHPQVIVVDELAHTNVPGTRNNKRYEDVQALLAAGIHVLTAMNVQHLESLYNTVEQLVGVKVRERVPDSVLADADQVVNIDVAPEDLQKRLNEGKIYPRERVASSLTNYFREANLQHLRELALRELASQIDARRRGDRPDGASSHSGNEQIMVCLSSKVGSSARLLRFGSRLAGRLNRNWYAVYVQTPREEPTRIDPATQRVLSDTLTLANQLGATVFTFKGTDVAETILQFAREYRVGQVVIGKPHAIPLWRRFLFGHRSVAERLIFRAKVLTVIVIDAEAEELPSAPTSDPLPIDSISEVFKHSAGGGESAGPAWVPGAALASLLAPRRIRIWDEPITVKQLFRGLAESVAQDDPSLDVDEIVGRMLERESRGSTFLNEGVALPHARIERLAAPQVALGITRGGLLDAPVERPVQATFLLLSPPAAASDHLRILAVAAKALQRKEVRARLGRAKTASEMLAALNA